MTTPPQGTLSATLENLPLSRKHLIVWAMASVGFMIEAIDLTIVGAVLPVLSKHFDLSSFSVGLISDAALAGYMIGVASVGILADRLGRARMMRTTILVFTVLTLASAFAWNTESFGVLRFLAGIGIGGEAALLTPYIIEVMPRKYRGRLAGLGDTFFTVGLPVATLIGLIIIPLSDDGWRWALLMAGAPALYVLFMRRNVPESPRWLELNGRGDEASEIVRSLGGSWRPTAQSEQSDNAGAAHKASLRHAITAVWSRQFASRTARIWGVWFFLQMVYYTFLLWLPSMLVGRGYSLVDSLQYTLIMNAAAIFGGITMSFVQESRLGRRYTLAMLFGLSVIAAIGFSMADSTAAIVVAGSAMSFLMNGCFAVLYTLTPESYPTAIRSSGQGCASMFGKVGALLGPVAVGAALPIFEMSGVFVGAAIALSICLLCVVGLRETRGRSVDDEEANQADRVSQVNRSPMVGAREVSATE
ncbi:MFS transporter [Rhodococcus sp. T7]|uniref:MFS transporter n=1 Tax=Rhodococcus sp. T7 TaxID=627444 RepID=UPI001358DFD7|nr:MFS transporter [Rhodococcus sp. T7]KAF0964476.1 putative niacin/nicotinamide transporter NaiP [Rhodococcus sp. T7]